MRKRPFFASYPSLSKERGQGYISLKKKENRLVMADVGNPSDEVPPEARVDEKESRLHQLDSLSLLLYTTLLTVTVLTIWLFKHKRIRYLHETGLALFYGLAIGAIVRYGVGNRFGEQTIMKVKPISTSELKNTTQLGPPDILWLEMKNLHNKPAEAHLFNRTLAYSFKGEVLDGGGADNQFDQKTTFDPEIFFNILLPPIIFHAGYSMKKRYFFRNIGAILAFAFIGTTLSTFTIAGIMFGITRMFAHLAPTFTFLDTVRFGALISATDPVTILAIFTDLHVDVNLYAIVFGESVLNDAVAMVITRTLEDYEESTKLNSVPTPAYQIFFSSFGEFILIFTGSFLIGAVMGCVTAMMTKFTKIRNHAQLESTLFVLMSYSTFLIAEVVGLTGIVSVLSCGICQAHYTYNNLSSESRIVTKQFFGLLNFMAENFIFCYVGVSMFTYPKHNFDAAFIFGSIFAIIVGRAVNIYPLSFLLNLGRKSKITWNLQHMLFLSGLRGAIAFALAIRNTLTDARQMILTATLVIVMLTVVICGGSTLSLLTWFGIPIGVEDEEDKVPLSSSATPNHTYNSVNNDAQVPPGSIPAGKSWAAKLWSGFDSNYMKPLLTHSNPTLMETAPACCLPAARFLTSTEQLSRHPAMINGGFGDAEDQHQHQGVVIDNDTISIETSDASGGFSSSADPPNKDDLKQRFPSDI